LKQCYPLLPNITNIIKMTLSTGIFPDEFKNCYVYPHIKKSNLHKYDLGNYHPTSHLSFLSKFTEVVVKSRLADYFSTNNFIIS